MDGANSTKIGRARSRALVCGPSRTKFLFQFVRLDKMSNAKAPASCKKISLFAWRPMLCRSREKEKDSEEIAWERTRETVSRSMPLKGNIMVPRNKTKLAHCLIICVTVMVWPSPSSSLSRGAFVHLRFSAALFLFEVFILIIIFLYFSRCLSYSCYYYLLAIIDTMSILLLFVSMWLPPPPPPLPLSPSLIVRIADDICVHNFFYRPP